MKPRYQGCEFIKPPQKTFRTLRGVHLPLTIDVPIGYELHVKIEARRPTGKRRCTARDSGGTRCRLAKGHSPRKKHEA